MTLFKRSSLITLSMCLLLMLLWGCDGDDPSFNDGGVSDSQSADLGVADAGSPDTGATLPGGLKAGWNILYPGGNTICSRGDKYMFAVSPGTVNRVVVDFEGGGACWTYLSCSVAGALFKEKAEDSLKYVQQGYSHGIYDRKNPKNPFKDWYHVFIPYCTGDIHWGNKVSTYKDPTGTTSFNINHKGAVNAGAVLDWIYKSFSRPEKIFVTGCSAGSYGSAMWASYLAQHYTSSRIYQFGDSGAGIITASFLKDSFPNWNAIAASPAWIPTMDPKKVDLLSKDITYVYTAVANYYSKHVVSQYNTLMDKTQVMYYQVMGGGSAAEWSKKMKDSIDAIIKGAKSFRAFMTSDNSHCIIPYDELYTAETNGIKLIDWLTDMVNDKPIQSQRCSLCVPVVPDGGPVVPDGGPVVPDGGAG